MKALPITEQEVSEAIVIVSRWRDSASAFKIIGAEAITFETSPARAKAVFDLALLSLNPTRPARKLVPNYAWCWLLIGWWGCLLAQAVLRMWRGS